MIGAPKRPGDRMGDCDDGNNSGGSGGSIIGSIISILLLASTFHYWMMPKAWRWMVLQLGSQADEVNLDQHNLANGNLFPRLTCIANSAPRSWV